MPHRMPYKLYYQFLVDMPIDGMPMLNCVTVCVHDVLPLTADSSRLYSVFSLCFPGIDSKSTVTLTRVKRFLKMNE